MSREQLRETKKEGIRVFSPLKIFLRWLARTVIKVSSVVFKALRIRKLGVILAVITVGFLSTVLTSILFWVSKGIFRTNLSDPISTGLLMFLFGLILWAIASTEDLQSIGEKKSQDYFDSKLNRYSLQNRYLVRVSLFRIGLILSLGTFWYGFFATYAGESHAFFLDAFIVGIILVLISPLFISNKNISLLFFRKFRNAERKNIDELSKALNRYNRSVDFCMSSKSLSSIYQYAEHVYNLDLKDCRNSIDANLDEIIKSLEDKKFCEIPRSLLQISMGCEDFIQKYKSIGIEIKPSNWTKVKETIASSIPKVVPNLIWLMILFAIGFMLRDYIPIQISLR